MLALNNGEKPQRVRANKADEQTVGDPRKGALRSEELVGEVQSIVFDGTIDIGDEIDEKRSAGERPPCKPEDNSG